MSIFGNVANMFRPTQQVTIAPAPGAQPNSIQQAPAPMAQVNPQADPALNPNLQSPPNGSGATPPNPLDDLAQLWHTDPKATPAPDPFAAPIFNTDPTKIQQSAAKVDFLKNVPQEVMAKVMAGNDPQAIAQLINLVGQQTLAAAAQLNAATIEQSHARNNERLFTDLPNRIKNVQIQQGTAENPALNHAAAQPFVKMVRQQIAAKDPSLTPMQVNQKAEQVLLGFATAINAPAQEQQQQQQVAAAGTDWDTWAGVTS